MTTTATGAVFSPCKTWRYELWRTWDAGAWPLVMVMLNPSTADETVNDPTVERCERRARTQNFGGLIVLNAFAFRATDPAVMKATDDPVGPENNAHLTKCFEHAGWAQRQPGGAGPVVCVGWGVHGAHRGRDKDVQALAAAHGVQLMCLGVTAAGQPRHPLYVGYDVPLQPWSAP